MPLPLTGVMMNHDMVESYCQMEHAPSFKRMTDLDSNFQNLAIKSKMNSPNLQGRKGTCHIFYKTRMCAMFLKETCNNGKNCTFDHGVKDLREPHLNWQDFIYV